MNALAERVRRVPVRTWLIIFFAGMGWMATWFVIRPLLGPHAVEGYYRPVLHVFTYGFNQPLVLVFIPYLLALLAWRRGSRVPVGWLLGGAIALHLLLVFAPTPQSYDIHQYLFYGRMQVLDVGAQSHIAHAGNPYVIQPVAGWTDDWFRWVKWPTQTTVYGPLWSLLAYGVALASGGSHTVAYLLMKLVILGLDLAVIRMILVASRNRSDPQAAAGFGIMAYALNPLILTSVPLGGLADVALAAGFLGAFVAERRGRPWVTTVLLTLATLVKVYGGIGLLLWLVLLVRRKGLRQAALHGTLAVAIAAALFAPYWAGLGTFHGLFHVANLSNHSFSGALQRLLTPVMRVLGSNSPWHVSGAFVRWVGLALLVATVAWSFSRTRSRQEMWHNVLLVMAVYCLFTPWFFYWYLVAPIALVAVMPEDSLAMPVLTASGSLLITVAFYPWLLGQAVEAILRYAPPVIVYALGIHDAPRAPRSREPGDPAVGTPDDARTSTVTPALEGAGAGPAASAP